MPADKILRFNRDGKFTILTVADMHLKDNGEKGSADTLKLLEASLIKFDPDLTVLLGDNTSGWKGSSFEGVERVISSITEIFDRHKKLFAVVFGNHDHETGVSNKEQAELFQKSEYCLLAEGDCEVGCGNYNLPILRSDSDKMAFNLWMIDSRDYYEDENGNRSYAFVSDEQIAWYEKKSEELKKKNGGMPVYSLVFQHITVPEQYRLLKAVHPLTPFAVKGHGAWSDRRFVIARPKYTKGALGEGPCPPDINNGQFMSWLKTGDVIGAVFGHDHINDFVGDVDGIKLIQTRGAGFTAYGDGIDRGVRLITLYENEPKKLKTDTYYYTEIVGSIPTTLPLHEMLPLRIKKKLICAGSAALLTASLLAAAKAVNAIKKCKHRV